MLIRDAAAIVRGNLTMEQIVGVYLPNERIKRGFISCPFHGETVGSLKLYDDSFYCFGCHAGGDAVDFVRRLFNLSAADAVTRLNDDFALGLPLSNATMRDRLDAKRRSAELLRKRKHAATARRRRADAYADASDKYAELTVQMRDNAPVDHDAPFPDAWIAAARKIDQAAWELDGAELPDGS